MEPGEGQATSHVLTWTEMTVEEEAAYFTVMPHLLAAPSGGYYPGELTIELSGAVTVRAGGCLTIGKFAVGGPEASPILRMGPEGVIRVEAGAF